MNWEVGGGIGKQEGVNWEAGGVNSEPEVVTWEAGGVTCEAGGGELGSGMG